MLHTLVASPMQTIRGYCSRGYFVSNPLAFRSCCVDEQQPMQCIIFLGQTNSVCDIRHVRCYVCTVNKLSAGHRVRHSVGQLT